ncbi:hypothetical protein C8R44DRAFT_877688 [Mycena epipterygia]|nr:hypothetical protein C8R44DRAFT_877688 [Mycena epipterygia]
MTGGFGPSLGPSLPDDPSRWKGTARVLGPKWTHLPALTIGLLGVQIFWSVEMSYASPYLISLGFSTSHVALVFLAGPFSGLVVQPLVGAFADTNTSRWGRRRPYILAGCLLCVTGMLLLGYTRAVAGVFTQYGSHANDVLTTIFAVISIFIIDFSINAVQAVDRALLVDTLPPAAQAAGNACAALMLGFGSVVGFFVGNLPLRSLLPFLQADSELQALSVLVSVLLLAFHGITAALVRERVLLKTIGTPRPSITHEIREIWIHAWALPRVIQQICVIQFFAWLGWFPVLFYTTMYITDIYLRAGGTSTSPSSNITSEAIPSSSTALRMLARATSLASASATSNSALSPAPSASASLLPSLLEQTAAPQRDADAPTRLGARAQLISALLALATNALLPFVIPDAAATPRRRGLRNSRLMGRVDLGPENGSGPGMKEIGGARRWQWRVPDAVRVPLPTLWAASHAIFAACMVGSFFTHSVAGATILIACTGFSWGVTQWAPFSLLAEAILTAPAPTAGAAMSMTIRLADTRTARPEEEEGFLVSRPGEGDSDSESDSSELEFVRADEAFGHTDDGEAPGGGRGNDLAEGRDSRESERKTRGRALLGNPHAQLSVVDVLTPMSTYTPRFGDPEQNGGAGLGVGGGDEAFGGAGEDEGGGGGLSAKAGVILGIHNIFIVIPQFLVTGLAAIIFAIFDGPPPVLPSAAPTTGPPAPVEAGRNSVVYVFRIGGIWACIAFVLAWRLARELRRK